MMHLVFVKPYSKPVLKIPGLPNILPPPGMDTLVPRGWDVMCVSRVTGLLIAE